MSQCLICLLFAVSSFPLLTQQAVHTLSMPPNLIHVSSDSFVCIIQSLLGLAAGIQHMAAVQQPAGESEHLHPQERVSYLQRSQLGLHQCDQWDPVPGLPAIRARQPCPAGPLHTPVLPSHHAHPGLCPAAAMVRQQNDAVSLMCQC